MSALSVGTTAATVSKGNRQPPAQDDAGPGGKFVKWIPGDAVAFYAALLTMGTVEGAAPSDPLAQLRSIDEGSAGWFVFALASAVALVVMGAYGKRQRSRRSDEAVKVDARSMALRGVLTAAAFTLWATLLPESWPNSWSLVQNLGAAYPLVLALIATVFTFIAESVTRRFNL